MKLCRIRRENRKGLVTFDKINYFPLAFLRNGPKKQNSEDQIEAMDEEVQDIEDEASMTGERANVDISNAEINMP